MGRRNSTAKKSAGHRSKKGAAARSRDWVRENVAQERVFRAIKKNPKSDQQTRT